MAIERAAQLKLPSSHELKTRIDDKHELVTANFMAVWYRLRSQSHFAAVFQRFLVRVLSSTARSSQFRKHVLVQ